MWCSLLRLLSQYPKLCSVQVTSTNCGRSTCVKFYICESYPAVEVSAASLPGPVSSHRHPDRTSPRGHSPGVSSLPGGSAESGRAAQSQLCLAVSSIVHSPPDRTTPRRASRPSSGTRQRAAELRSLSSASLCPPSSTVHQIERPLTGRPVPPRGRDREWPSCAVSALPRCVLHCLQSTR